MISKNRPFYGKDELLSLFKKGGVTDFEHAFADLIGRKYAVSFPYGRSALYTILKALGIVNKEIIIPAYTCIVVPNAIVYSGNRPVFADISLEDFNMRPQDAESAITENTAAVVTTHMYGYPAETASYKKSREEILVIEDCALSLRTCMEGRAGEKADISFFSSGINKEISTVEGGMVVTDRPDLYEKIKSYRDENFKKAALSQRLDRGVRFLLSYIFFNEFVYYFMRKICRIPALRSLRESRRLDKIDMPSDFLARFTDFQARIGMSQLKKIRGIAKRRLELVKYYNGELKSLPGLILPPEVEGSAYSHYALRVKERDKIDFVNKMLRRGIEAGKTLDYYIPGFDFYAEYAKGSYPNSIVATREIANLPNYPSLSLQKCAYIVKCVKEILKERK